MFTQRPCRHATLNASPPHEFPQPLQLKMSLERSTQAVSRSLAVWVAGPQKVVVLGLLRCSGFLQYVLGSTVCFSDRAASFWLSRSVIGSATAGGDNHIATQ